MEQHVAQQQQQFGVLPISCHPPPGLTPDQLQVAKHSPLPIDTLLESEWERFLRVIETHGLDPDAGHKVRNGQLKYGFKPAYVAQDMSAAMQQFNTRTGAGMLLMLA